MLADSLHCGLMTRSAGAVQAGTGNQNPTRCELFPKPAHRNYHRVDPNLGVSDRTVNTLGVPSQKSVEMWPMAHHRQDRVASRSGRNMEFLGLCRVLRARRAKDYVRHDAVTST